MGYLVCKKCGGYYELQQGESPDEFSECSCGGELKHVESLDNVVEEPESHEDVIICPKCGKHNKITAKFCVDCGTTLSNVTNISKPESEETSGERVGWWNRQSRNAKLGMGIAGACCIGLILLVVIVGLMLPNNIASNTSTYSTSSSNQTYSANGVSFNYPGSWTTYTPILTSSEVANLKTKKGDTTIFTVKRSSATRSLDSAKSSEYASFSSSGNVTSTEDITVGDVKAFKITGTYNDIGSGGQELIGFIKNGYEYHLIFTSGNLSAVQSDINTIVESFKVN